MPGAAEFVVPGSVVHLKIVERIFPVVDTVCAQVEVVVNALGCVAHTAGEGRLRIRRPRRDIVAGRDACLHGPAIIDLNRRQNAGIRERVHGIKKLVAEHVVVRRQLRFDSRN